MFLSFCHVPGAGPRGIKLGQSYSQVLAPSQSWAKDQLDLLIQVQTHQEDNGVETVETCENFGLVLQHTANLNT